MSCQSRVFGGVQIDESKTRTPRTPASPRTHTGKTDWRHQTDTAPQCGTIKPKWPVHHCAFKAVLTAKYIIYNKNPQAFRKTLFAEQIYCTLSTNSTF